MSESHEIPDALRATECTAILILIIMYTRGQPVLSVIALIGVCIDK